MNLRVRKTDPVCTGKTTDEQETLNDADDETTSLCPPNLMDMSQTELSKEEDVTYRLSIRKLAAITLALVVSSYALVGGECVHTKISAKHLLDKHIITKWRVTNKRVNVRKGAKATTEMIGTLYAGDVVEVLGDADGRPFDARGLAHNVTADRLHLVSPLRGFTSAGTSKGSRFLEKLDQILPEAVDDGMCPLFAAGDHYPKSTRFRYAPTTLVVAQCLWNAAQVAQLLLLVVFQAYVRGGQMLYKLLVAVTLIGTVCLLPFSVYLISPGGYFFAIFVVGCALVAMSLPSDMLLRLGERRDAEKGAISKQAPQLLLRVEVIAFFCFLGSCMYNYNASQTVWPYWNSIFRSIDDYFGWKGADLSVKSDVLWTKLYTLGLGDRVPLFVPTAVGSTTGHLVFLVIWSVLPTLYASYFGILLMKSKNSPGACLQRALCIFGIIHFLFFTDAVGYKFGRGFMNPYADFCHWLERFAWRIAILLPIYQNVVSGYWRRTCRNQTLGKLVELIISIWGVHFFVYQVVLDDFWLFGQYMLGKERAHIHAEYSHIRGYHGALVFMVIFYGLRVCGCVRGHQLSLSRVGRAVGKYKEVPTFDIEEGSRELSPTRRNSF